MVCLIFLIINGIRLLIMSGETLTELPASSIFLSEGEKNVIIRGQIYKKSNTSKNQILYLKNNSITYQNQIYYESKILIYDNTFSEVPIGKVIELCGTLEKFEQARNPGNFNQKVYYAKQGIYGFCYLEDIMDAFGKENVLQEQLYQFRKKWEITLLNHMCDENGPILCAMLLAEKAGMDQDIKELYQRNGISHVLAISGLHISFIGMGTYRILRKRLRFSYPIAGFISTFILSIYVLMIGMSISVVRAFIMLLLRIGADVTGRVYDMLTALMLSAAILVTYEPLYLTDAAFYMSHGAILGIQLVFPLLKTILSDSKRVPFKNSKVWNGCLSSLAINLTLLPVLLYFYYEIPAYSILVNVLIIPLMSILLGCGMFGSFLSICIPIVGNLLLTICDFILTGFEWISKIGCKLPFASIVIGKPEWWEILIYYGIVLVCFIQKKEILEKRQKVLIGLFLCSCFIFVKIPDGNLHITMLDVGQGDCIFIKGPRGGTYLVDGGSSDQNQIGKYRIEPYLKSEGIGCIDYVFLSHGDLDHCNGIVEMLERQGVGVKIRNIVLPTNYLQDDELIKVARTALKQGVSVCVLEANKSITEGELHIKCLQPTQYEADLSGNAGSMVLEVMFCDFEMLFTGDVEGKGEARLRERLQGKSYDVLKVAHHGSKNSSDKAFLAKVKPKLALISAGRENPYGHPHQETLDRLSEVESIVLETKECGAIMLEIGEEIKVNRWIN